jgi:hypothetical protein
VVVEKAATTSAAATSRSSVLVAAVRCRARSLDQRAPIRPPLMPPTRNEPSAVSDAQTEMPPAPAMPRKTTLPVMFATKTWPSFK